MVNQNSKAKARAPKGGKLNHGNQGKPAPAPKKKGK